ncbi:MAG: hypothetical protein EOO52_13665 [Gammaproteobacteria bacterium]|nr:MAG: hypothetical protein EOO52_13665 [Gammaproteobacteria bacterium]
MPAHSYSSFFSCIYDEPQPLGSIGRGTHYSVFRSVEWLDVERQKLSVPQVHDFAVIWDEDHDTRVIEAVERIYMAGLLSPIQFIGERKGNLFIVVAAKFWCGWQTEADIDRYTRQIQDIANDLKDGDAWPVEMGYFDRSLSWPPHQTSTGGIIQDTKERTITYLRHIDSLWSLGTKPYNYSSYS